MLGLALGAGYLLQTVGLQTTSAAVSGFITGMFVVLTPVGAALLLRTAPGRLAWAAVALATVGLALLSLKGLAVGGGELLTLGCAAAFALHIVGLGRFAAAFDAYGLAVVQLLAVTVLCAARGGARRAGGAPGRRRLGGAGAHRAGRHRPGVRRADLGAAAPVPHAHGRGHDDGAGLERGSSRSRSPARCSGCARPAGAVLVLAAMLLTEVGPAQRAPRGPSRGSRS